MRILDTPAKGSASPVDLASLSRPRLPKHRQQNDPPISGYPITDPHRVLVEPEPQLTQFPIELFRMWLTEQRSTLGEKVDGEGGSREMLGWKTSASSSTVPQVIAEML